MGMVHIGTHHVLVIQVHWNWNKFPYRLKKRKILVQIARLSSHNFKMNGYTDWNWIVNVISYFSNRQQAQNEAEVKNHFDYEIPYRNSKS